MMVYMSRTLTCRQRHRKATACFQNLMTTAPRSNSSSSIKPKTNLPRNILLLRHGRSLGNDDETAYAVTPDWKIPLSIKGRKQAREAGKRIQRILGNYPVFFYVSPYLRAKQTLEEVKSSITSDVLFTREEPRLREQDFGNFQDVERIKQAKIDRVKFGRFFYRFPDGESGADVFDRVAAFCGTFSQDCEQIAQPDSTAVFVTHGITLRLFIMRWLHWSVDDFETLHNPPNCGLLHLTRISSGSGGAAYRLVRESRELIKSPKEIGIGRGLQIGKGLEARMKIDEWDDLTESSWGL